MHASRLLHAAALAALALALVAPAASAHTAIYSTDNLVRGSIGLLNEPVVSYSKTGLDACFSENVTVVAPATRPPVAVNPGNLTATLKSPDGQTFTAALSAQFGRAGCVQFEVPLVLTQPGQYTVDIAGAVGNGSIIAATAVLAGGAVKDQSDIAFPDDRIVSNVELEQTIDSLTLQIAGLQARLATLEANAANQAGDSDNGQFAPGAPAALLMVGLAALVAVRRSR